MLRKDSFVNEHLCLSICEMKQAAADGPNKGRFSYTSALKNVGKFLLFIVIVPPFLNYASLQREGQILLPKGH